MDSTRQRTSFNPIGFSSNYKVNSLSISHLPLYFSNYAVNISLRLYFVVFLGMWWWGFLP